MRVLVDAEPMDAAIFFHVLPDVVIEIDELLHAEAAVSREALVGRLGLGRASRRALPLLLWRDLLLQFAHEVHAQDDRRANNVPIVWVVRQTGSDDPQHDDGLRQAGRPTRGKGDIHLARAVARRERPQLARLRTKTITRKPTLRSLHHVEPPAVAFAPELFDVERRQIKAVVVGESVRNRPKVVLHTQVVWWSERVGTRAYHQEVPLPKAAAHIAEDLPP
mmetsp:Transcript_103630/g.292470  ORF Transcript_103630/g.292470 Transcript_103630/m.292470 type:complete len:221 (+) Transcript_103630:1826-2488(+)